MRRDIRKPILWFAIVAAVALTTLLIFQLTAAPTPLKQIRSIEFSQSQAVPNFDDSSHTVRDQQRIREFAALVKKYDVDVTDYDTALNDGCTGGTATNIHLHFVDGSAQKLRTYACGGASGTFVQDVTDLFGGWKS